MVHDISSVRKRIIAVVLAGVMTVSVIAGALYFNGNKASAANITLRGIDTLVSAHSDGAAPFTIVEVVPNLSDASIGYFIGGEEPIDIDNAKAIKDMPSKQEREKYMAEYNTNKGGAPFNDYAYEYTSGYEESDDGAHSAEIRGVFEDAGGNGRYSKHETVTGGDYAVYTTDSEDALSEDERETAHENGTILYRRMDVFNLTGDGGYTLSFRTFSSGGQDMPFKYSGGGDAYNWQYFLRESRTFGENIEVNDYIYEGASDDLSYKGKVAEVVTDAEGNVTDYKDDNGNSLGLSADDTYWVIYETNSTGANDNPNDALYISGVTDGGGIYSKEQTYAQVQGAPDYDDNNCPTGEIYYISGNTGYQDYDFDNDGTYDSQYDFRADYSKDVYETFSYNNGFDNYELFKKYVFDRSQQTEYDSLSIDVVTITADKLGDYVGSADLVYFAGGNYTATVSDSSAVALINRVAAGELPVMMEYSTYSDNNDLTSNPEDTNLNKLALCLMQSGVSEIADTDAFNAIDTNADDGIRATIRKFGTTSKTIIEAKADDVATDISYAYGRVFVNDDSSEVGKGKIINTDFYEEYDQTKTDNGFTAVKNEIDTELTYIELIVNEELISTFNKKISKATSIRYILNNSSSRTVVKSKLNILDIEPYQSDQFDFTEGKKGTSYTDLNYGMMTRNASMDGNIAFFEYRDIMTVDWVKDNLDFSGEDEDVSIRQMGTKELVGINTDLNSTYDLIFLGADTVLIPTVNVLGANGNEIWKKNAANEDCKIKGYASTLHNDASLDGLIYTHMGDRFDNYSDNYGERIDYSNYASGNDITRDKLRELKDYIQAGYAVILSDTFVTKDGKVNTNRVDVSSNMYKLIAWLVEDRDTGDGKGGGRKYYGKNVQLKSNLEQIRSNPMYEGAANPEYDSYRKTIANYLNISKLELIVNSHPVAYDNGTYLTMASDGNYYLNFDVELKNDSSIDTSESTTYDCKLYLDMDADGKYEDVESIGGLMINNGSDVETDGHFHLTAGRDYSISRAVPNDYVGFLSWKLEFIQNEREGDAFDANAVRKSVIGYSAVPVKGEKPTIHVLQIIPNVGNTGIHWAGTVYNTFKFSDGTSSYSDYTYLNLNEAKMLELYKKVQDFNIEVDQITVQNYLLRYRWPSVDGIGYYKGTYYEFLSQYDMVVMGFTDGFSFASDRFGDTAAYDMNGYENTGLDDPANPGNQIWKTRRELYREAILGIREYTMSGRSILFTHDLTSHAANENRQGYFYNMYLRDVMGLDRFGQLATLYNSSNSYFDYGYDSTNKIPEYKSVYDSAEMNGDSISDKKAFNDHNILRYTRSDKYGLLSRWHTRETGSFSNETVTQLNGGQITQYPYKITDEDAKTFAVNETHAQYFQLNLDTDSTDENVDDDVVVWYVLSNADKNNTSGNDHQFYKEVQMDARNNYYIFTKGNVTYTGAGHRPVNDKERELFVNTLVAAYNSGLHAPRVTYKENPWEMSPAISATYLPYDPELIETEDDITEGGFLDNTLTVNFKTMNNNFRTSTELLKMAYYVEVKSDGDLTMNGKSYKRITPKTCKIVDSNGNKTDQDASLMPNYRIYQLTFDVTDLTVSNGSGGISNDDVKLYVRIGFDALEDGNIGSEPATESMNSLGVYTTRLFNLE